MPSSTLHTQWGAWGPSAVLSVRVGFPHACHVCKFKCVHIPFLPSCTFLMSLCFTRSLTVSLLNLLSHCLLASPALSLSLCSIRSLTGYLSEAELWVAAVPQPRCCAASIFLFQNGLSHFKSSLTQPLRMQQNASGFFSRMLHKLLCGPASCWDPEPVSTVHISVILPVCPRSYQNSPVRSAYSLPAFL